MPERRHGRHASAAACMAIAASLLIGLTAAPAVTWWLIRPDDYRTTMGERRVVTLSDGSKLSLDADSEVTVRYRQA